MCPYISVPICTWGKWKGTKPINTLVFQYHKDSGAGGTYTVELLTQQPAQIMAAFIGGALFRVALAYGRHQEA